MLIAKLDVINKLKAFSIFTQSLTKQEQKNGCFLLNLSTKEQEINIFFYPEKSLQQASDMYSTQESYHSDNPNFNIVLVASESIANLKKAFPNYFADSQAFLENLTKVLEPS